MKRRAYANLTAYFEASGETQQAFAARAGISQSYLSRISRGLQEPPLKLALKIARLANVPVESLLSPDETVGANSGKFPNGKGWV